MKSAAAASPTRRLPLTRCPMNAVAKIVTVFATIASAIPTATATSLSIQPTTRNGSSGEAEEERPAHRARRRLPLDVRDHRREEARGERGGARDHPVTAARIAAPGPAGSEDPHDRHDEQGRQHETEAGSGGDDRPCRVDVAARVPARPAVRVGREPGQRAAEARAPPAGSPLERPRAPRARGCPSAHARARHRPRASPRIASERRTYTGSMLVAGLLSLLVPGVGQLYRGATRRGLVLLGVTACIIVGGALFGSWVSLDALSGVDRSIVSALLAVDLALLAFRVFAVVDAARGAVPLLVAALVALTAAPHVAAAWVTVRSYDVLESVFADEEPCGTACDRGSVLLANVVHPLPEWVPKDAWEWALVERLGPGEVAPLDADARVLADAQTPLGRSRGRRSCCSAPTKGPETGARGPTRSSSPRSSTGRAAPPPSVSRATWLRCRSDGRAGRRRSR